MLCLGRKLCHFLFPNLSALFSTDLSCGCSINKLSPTQFAINIKLSLFNQFEHDCGIERLWNWRTHENQIVPFVPHSNLFSFLIHTWVRISSQLINILASEKRLTMVPISILLSAYTKMMARKLRCKTRIIYRKSFTFPSTNRV